MAGVRFQIRTGKIATGTAAITILQIVAASNHRVKLSEFSISFDGVSTTGTPILCELVKQTTAGTMTTAASTVKKNPDDAAETLQTTIQDTATAEPTTTDILKSHQVHPQSRWEWQARFGEEIHVGGGNRLGFRVTAAVSVNCTINVSGEE